MELFAPRHLIVVLLIVLLVFGTKKLKTIGADLGAAVRGFKDSMRSGEEAGAQVVDKVAPAQQIGDESTGERRG